MNSHLLKFYRFLRINPVRALAVLGPGLIALATCRQPETVPPLYFLMLQAPLAGNQGRPTRPLDLRATYEPLTQEVKLEWTASVDPDTQTSNLVYRVYLYLDGPPATYYRAQDLIDETPLTTYYLPVQPYTGSLYFVVTAFDGTAESEPSEAARLDLLPPADGTP